MSVKVNLNYDMEMPDSCADCEMWYIGIHTMEAKCCFRPYGIDVSYNIRDKNKPEWCPLEESEE